MSDDRRLDIYDFYTRLEPNHTVEVDAEGYQIVICPFRNPDAGGNPFVTTWSPNANPEEVDCAFCEHLHHLDDDPDYELPGCEGDA